MECPPSLLRKTQINLIITAQDDLTTNKKGIGKKNNKIIISSKLLHVPASAHAFITNAVKEEILFIPSLFHAEQRFALQAGLVSLHGE